MSTTTTTTSGSGSTSVGSGSGSSGSASTLSNISWWQTILIDVGVLVVGLIMLGAAFFIKADV